MNDDFKDDFNEGNSQNDRGRVETSANSPQDDFPSENFPQTKISERKCECCGDNMEFDPKSGCLKCPSCGNEKKILVRAGEELDISLISACGGNWEAQTHRYHCNNCNAEEVLDKREIAHVCPFCGSPAVVESKEIDTLHPNALLPFLLNREKATEAVTAWAKKKLLAPREYKDAFRPENLNGVYLPAFTFDTDSYSTYYGSLYENYTVTVRNGKETRQETRQRHFHVSGDHESFFDDIAVNATDAVPQSVINKLMRYDYHNCVEYTDEFLYGYTALLYTRDGKACWQEAQGRADSMIRREILSKYMHDGVDYLNVSTSYFNVTYKYLLLPMYTGNYQFKGKTYSFYVNGRSGKIKGKAPVSPIRATIAALIGLAVAALVGVGLSFLFR